MIKIESDLKSSPFIHVLHELRQEQSLAHTVLVNTDTKPLHLIWLAKAWSITFPEVWTRDVFMASLKKESKTLKMNF